MIKGTADFHLNIKIDNKPIKQIQECKSLGVIIDQYLSWNSNTENIYKKVTAGISALRRLKDFADRETLLYGAALGTWVDFLISVIFFFKCKIFF